MREIIIDGYNVIHRLPAFNARLKESLASARKALASHVRNWRKKYSNAGVCIVFDGKDQDFPEYSKACICGVDCIFTSTNENADTRIAYLLRESEDPRGIMVISDDNDIRRSARAHGAYSEPAIFLT